MTLRYNTSVLRRLARRCKSRSGLARDAKTSLRAPDLFTLQRSRPAVDFVPDVTPCLAAMYDFNVALNASLESLSSTLDRLSATLDKTSAALERLDK